MSCKDYKLLPCNIRVFSSIIKNSECVEFERIIEELSDFYWCILDAQDAVKCKLYDCTCYVSFKEGCPYILFIKEGK